MKTLPLRRAKNPTRKDIRKQERLAKKQRKTHVPVAKESVQKSKPVRKTSKPKDVPNTFVPEEKAEDEFALDPHTFDYLDEEIRVLEKKLGLRKGKQIDKDGETERNWRKMRKYLDLDGLGENFYDVLEGKQTEEPGETVPMDIDKDVSDDEAEDDDSSSAESERDQPDLEEDKQEEEALPPPKMLPVPAPGDLKKKLNAILNRLSEQNIDPLTTQLTHSTSEVNEALVGILISTCVSQENPPLYILTANVAAVCALSVLVGKEVTAFIVKTVFELYIDPATDRHARKHSLVWISYMYLFNSLSGLLMCGLIKDLGRELNEGTIELLIEVLNVVGFKLRKDEPAELKAIILDLQTRAKCVKAESKRTEFMLEVLLNIKNNKKKLTKDDRLVFLKTWLKTTVKQKGKNRDSVLKATWDDLSSKRWRELVSVSAVESSVKSIQKLAVDPKLEELARAQHMNTEIRRLIFYTVMTSNDYKDAYYNLMTHSNRSIDKEIMRVLLTCCGQEQRYNEYYALLAEEFLQHNKKLKYDLQFALWDQLKQVEEFSTRKVANLARFAGRLISLQMADFTCLKIIALDNMQLNLSLFFRILMEDLLRK